MTDEALDGVDRVVNAIGPRLRELRLQRGLSLQQLADRAGVSSAAIHKIERNGMVPTITTLLKLAEALERPVAYFVDEQPTHAGPVAFTPAAARPALVSSIPDVDIRAISGSYARFLMAATVTTVQPGAGRLTPRPECQSEQLVFVVDVELTFEIDGTEYRLAPGDTLHLRSDEPYRWTNQGDVAAQAVWVTLRPL